MGNVTAIPRLTTLGVRTVRVAIYIRVSTADQAKRYGLEVQEAAGRAFTREKCRQGLNWELYKVYSDEGVSGKLIDRPAMRELERDVLAGKIDVIIVHKFDRVGRTGRAFWTWVWGMGDHGVDFVSVSQRVDTTTTAGMAQLQMYATFAEMEYNLIRERTQGGRQAKAQTGGWPGGPAPYGYSIEGNGKRGSILAVNPEEARVIHLIAELIVDQGCTVAETARRLNVFGITTRSARPWTTGNLLKRLDSDSIDGTMTFRRTDGKNGHNRTVLDASGYPVHGDTVIIQIPRILTPERAAALRKCLARRAWSKTEHDRVYPLTGHVVGMCGHQYVGNFRVKTNNRYYRCQGKQAATACTDSYFEAEAFENAIWDQVVELLTDEERLHQCVKDFANQLPGNLDAQRARVADLEKGVAENRAAIKRLMTAFAKQPGMAQELAEESLTELTAELTQVQKVLEEARNVLAEHEHADQQVQKMLEQAQIARTKLRTLSLTEMREVLDVLQVKVEVTGQGNVRNGGTPNPILAWHWNTRTPVPGELSGDEWATVASIILERHGVSHFYGGANLRMAFNAIVRRLRTGETWEDLPPEYGNPPAVQARQRSWFRTGTWQVLMEHLEGREDAVVVTEPVFVPDFKLTGKIIPELLAAGLGDGEQAKDENTLVSASTRTLVRPDGWDS